MLLAAVAVIAFVLGFVGFSDYFSDIGVAKSPSDLVYLSLQLFTLESGSVPESGAPWTLEVARLAAPATTATALIAGLAVAFQERIDSWRLRRMRGHVVVCGLGAAGAMLAGRLLDAGHRVVGIDTDVANPAVETLRRRGASRDPRRRKGSRHPAVGTRGSRHASCLPHRQRQHKRSGHPQCDRHRGVEHRTGAGLPCRRSGTAISVSSCDPKSWPERTAHDPGSTFSTSMVSVLI